jgi:L-fuconolactonase
VGGSYTHRELIADMDRVGVDEAVVVTTPLYGRGPRANEYTMRGIEAHPDRLWGVGLIPFFEDEAVLRERVRQVTGHERMLGVRMHAALAYEEIPTDVNRTGEWILDRAHDPVFEAAAEGDAAVFLFPKADQLSMVATLADRHPETTLVVDHMGWPDETTGPEAAPWTDFEAVAERHNVSVKVSSLPRSAGDSWPYEDMQRYLANLLEWFGPERLMLGSDYPWMDSWADYADCLSWVEAADILSGRDRAYLSYRTFESVHG